MRSVAVPLILIGALASTSRLTLEMYPSVSTPPRRSKASARKSAGDSQDATGHYCSTDCHGGPGTDCVVGCKTGLPCVAQVIGSRRPTNLANALQAPPGSPR